MNYVLLDTNIIIYAINESDKDFQKAQTFINENLSRLVVADQNINEALRILTHKKFKRSVGIRTALRAVRRITDECTHITPNIETRELFFKLIRKYKIPSDNIYDTYLVATALSNSISQIATNNIKDFKVFKEIEVESF